MKLSKNLQYLRTLMGQMTQEELAERMEVSRQTISKWELGTATPELEKLMQLCELFNISLDELVKADLQMSDSHFSEVRVEKLDGFQYLRYAVLSREPEDDAIDHVRKWAKQCGDDSPKIIGWDLPILSQEQINVYHMHGYTAAWVLPEGMEIKDPSAEVMTQAESKYVVITIREPFTAPFMLIPEAYKILMYYMKVNGIEGAAGDFIDCFEYSYFKDGTEYMDVYIAVK